MREFNNLSQNKQQSPYHDLQSPNDLILLEHLTFLQPCFFIILFQPHQISCCSPNRPRTLWPESLCTLCYCCLENFSLDISLIDFFVSFMYCSNVTVLERNSLTTGYMTQHFLPPSLSITLFIFFHST